MKTVDFSETIEACDLKFGKCRELIDFMKVCIEGQGHFLTLTPGHLHMKIKTCFSKIFWAIFNQILHVCFQVQCWSHDQDGRHAHI